MDPFGGHGLRADMHASLTVDTMTAWLRARAEKGGQGGIRRAGAWLWVALSAASALR